MPRAVSRQAHGAKPLIQAMAPRATARGALTLTPHQVRSVPTAHAKITKFSEVRQIIPLTRCLFPLCLRDEAGTGNADTVCIVGEV